MSMRDIGDLIIYVGAVAAALAAIGVLLRFLVVRPLKRWLAEQIGAVRASTQQVQATADQVHAEVSPNHGNSLKDAVTRTEVAVDGLTRRFDDHLINHPRS